MRRYLLYVGSLKQIDYSRNSLLRIDAELFNGDKDAFLIKHSSLGELELVVTLLSDIKMVTNHLRHWPVDLLIYDERLGAMDAIEAIAQMEEDIKNLAQLWGPDFHFPKGRMIVLLEPSQDISGKTFALGRSNVKDVIVAPPTLAKTLRWVARLIGGEEKQHHKIGAAFSGGAVEGFLYQAGCTYALNRALKQGSLYDCQAYSGVSSGSVISAALAAEVPLHELILSIKGKSTRLPPFSSSLIYDVAGKHILSRIAKQTLEWEGLNPDKIGQKILKSFPTALLKGDRLHSFVLRAISEFNSKNSFVTLENDLFIGTTHQDTFEHVVMGLPPWQDVHISDAVRASCALPPFFAPHKIGGQTFIDGQITGVCNLELLVKRRCNLIFIIDPIIPYSSYEVGMTEKLGGIYTLIQSIKSLLHTRFRSELAHLTERFADVDFLVFQPYDECAEAMRGSPLKYWINTKITDLAYSTTLRRLRERHNVYNAKLSKYGFQLSSPEELYELERHGLEI